MTGAFDKARRLVAKARPKLKSRFHIWGGRKILELLAAHPEVATRYGHFLTPGHILTEIYNQFKDARAEIEETLRYLIVNQFQEQKFTKLDQAGSDADSRPGIHRLFIDLPCRAEEHDFEGLITASLVRAAGKCHRVDTALPETKEWRSWRRHPLRARVWFIRAGPGHGKSTIGQYYSQVQRAALILQPDGPKVLPAVKAEAEEIRDFATRAGFWSDAPRIPLLIELKDYAQWLGQRKKTEPQGILTFFADRLSTGVEKRVEPGLIKRALRTRSWFIAFDGLDEVPQDVKDSVALEVRNFLDNVAIECDCDLLALCTSRPQGYSGQFADLDGPTLELTNLSPEQALECAKPVVELGRSLEEAKRSLAVLHAAVAIGSVSELMTTPLQAHIMAVVVRDGGRPPDRRWQLFDNFYQVIKRREANKNLPDIQIARLLREDEKLLKTLHNRLGFLLHSRAETSKGAQTHIIRDEFKALAEAAVAQMVETGGKDVVDALMRAAKDRLVLVSTPDDGDHLRFDIRPLQEFFAAEFLYESIDARELRARLDTIAGDAHWREVTHFLLSALVENDRQTDLSVAVDALESLNEGDGDPQARLLRRRLGRGALVGARLLQEGVLEQDKRNRQQFRKSIEPMCAFASTREVNPLLRVRQPNSKQWLDNFLVDWLAEADRSESLGALISLAQVLPDTHPRVEQVAEFLLASPPDYTAALLRGLVSPEWRPGSPQTWFVKTIMAILSKPDWSRLEASGIGAAIHLLNQSPESTNKAARHCGFTDGQIELVKILIASGDRNVATPPDVNYGLVMAIQHEHDWTTGTVPFASWTAHLSEQTAKVSGMFSFLYRLLRWSRTKHFEDFQSLMELVSEDVISLFPGLPDHIRALLPLDENLTQRFQLLELKSLSQPQFEELISAHVINGRRVLRPRALIRRGINCTPAQWERLVNELPRFAFYMWSQESWQLGFGGRPKELDEQRTIDVLIDKLIRVPSAMTWLPGLWGGLLQVSGGRQDELRCALRVAALEPVAETRTPLYGFSPFQLHLPDDAACLPHLVNGLVALQDPPPYYRDVLQPVLDVAKLAIQFGNEVNSLRDLITRTSQAPSIKAAAIILLLLQPNGRSELEAYGDLLVKCYHRGIGRWFFRAVSGCLKAFSAERAPEVQNFIGKLLDATRSDFESRSGLDSLFCTWREASYAPVQTAGMTERWLRGEPTQPPNLFNQG
jgi:hypothetical protein